MRDGSYRRRQPAVGCPREPNKSSGSGSGSPSGAAWLFISRFVTGLHNVIGLLAGTSGMPVRRFLPVCAASCVVWAGVTALEYYFFGHALAGASTWLQIVLICIGIASTVLTLGPIRRRALNRLRAADPGSA